MENNRKIKNKKRCVNYNLINIWEQHQEFIVYYGQNFQDEKYFKIIYQNVDYETRFI